MTAITQIKKLIRDLLAFGLRRAWVCLHIEPTAPGKLSDHRPVLLRRMR